MDRVLLIIDDIQYAGHLETTLRKVGFDPETITNEYNLPDKLLSFNPDYIIAKGASTRVSSLNIGKKLKENSKYPGKVVLIFSEETRPSPEDLIKLRMDLLLFEPISALRLVAHLLTLTTMDKEGIMDKLVRFAHTDTQFRSNEQQILKTMGATIDSEIQIVSGQSKDENESILIDEKAVMSFVQPDYKEPEVESEASATSESDSNVSNADSEEEYAVTDTYKLKIQSEIQAASEELPLRIDTYNRAIKDVDQDLQKGLNKRETKVSNKKFFAESETSVEDRKKHDEDRKNFVIALMKK